MDQRLILALIIGSCLGGLGGLLRAIQRGDGRVEFPGRVRENGNYYNFGCLKYVLYGIGAGLVTAAASEASNNDAALVAICFGGGYAGVYVLDKIMEERAAKTFVNMAVDDLTQENKQLTEIVRETRGDES